MKVRERGCKDKMLIEQLFWSYKWECVYLRDRLCLKELKEITKEWWNITTTMFTMVEWWPDKNKQK